MGILVGVFVALSSSRRIYSLCVCRCWTSEEALFSFSLLSSSFTSSPWRSRHRSYSAIKFVSTAPRKFAKTASLMALTISSKPGTNATKSFTEASRVMTTSPRAVLLIIRRAADPSSTPPPLSKAGSKCVVSTLGVKVVLSSPNVPSIVKRTVSSKLNSFGMPSNSSFSARIEIVFCSLFGINAMVARTVTRLPTKSNGKSCTFHVVSVNCSRLVSSGKVTATILDPSLMYSEKDDFDELSSFFGSRSRSGTDTLVRDVQDRETDAMELRSIL
mmetsp:Transcript_4858/g.14478  ORF Transcript_4858/g.14478 Transcript_4858/m.14478 type:complete len:273 (-) Transcript_4858:152-970(-)